MQQQYVLQEQIVNDGSIRRIREASLGLSLQTILCVLDSRVVGLVSVDPVSRTLRVVTCIRNFPRCSMTLSLSANLAVDDWPSSGAGLTSISARLLATPWQESLAAK
jgi:hypothetical protein